MTICLGRALNIFQPRVDLLCLVAWSFHKVQVCIQNELSVNPIVIALHLIITCLVIFG